MASNVIFPRSIDRGPIEANNDDHYDGEPFAFPRPIDRGPIEAASNVQPAAVGKQFITRNEMTWLHYRDGGFEGPLSRLFGVEAIPHTFTIDADGVLQDEQIGDNSIEGKLKKLI